MISRIFFSIAAKSSGVTARCGRSRNRSRSRPPVRWSPGCPDRVPARPPRALGGIVTDQLQRARSSRETNSILASCAILSARSPSSPSSAIATVRLTSEGEMPLTISVPLMFLGNCARRRPETSGRSCQDSTGFRFVRLYLKSASYVGMISCGSLLRTSAGKRESSGIAGDLLVAQSGILRENPARAPAAPARLRNNPRSAFYSMAAP